MGCDKVCERAVRVRKSVPFVILGEYVLERVPRARTSCLGKSGSGSAW
jgi:hypothetical protein